MKHTNLLRIVVENKFTDLEFAIHPNDGEDIDLYTRDNKMDVFAGQSIDKLNKGEGNLGEGELHLLNECTMGNLMVSESLHKRLNYSEEALVIRNDDKVYLTFREI
jgi:hypothetical protein